MVSLSVEDYKYSLHRFPTNVCISDGPVSFYSITVIIDVLVGIGAYLLFVVFWIIHKVNIFLINIKTYYDYFRNLFSNQILIKITDN